MKRYYVISIILALLGAPAPRLAAQEAQYGFAVPLQITGGLMETGRAEAYDSSGADWSVGFHLLAEPEVRLGAHWYAYSAIQVRSTPFFYQDAYSYDREIKTNLLQGFVGYTRSWGGVALNLKAGKLASAFGSFPLQYDDASNPLLDQPLPYLYLDPARGIQGYSWAPVTLYGLPGAEADVSWRRLDGRFQLTNSSPYYPRSLFSSGQHAQWTAGAGYTIWQGFRVGFSAYRGAWLDDTLVSEYPPGTSAGNYPATGAGIDVQWARGYWSVRGEWDRFAFNYPEDDRPPRLSFGYAEAKRILSPRWYAAVRAGYQKNDYVIYDGAESASTYLPDRQVYEFAVGFRPNRLMLLKAGYEWVNVAGGPRAQDNVFGLQFITSINSIAKAFK